MDAPSPVDHRDVLRREFHRITVLTNLAFLALAEHEGRLAETTYRDWATILLRYHDALERIEGKDGLPNVPSMKEPR